MCLLKNEKIGSVNGNPKICLDLPSSSGWGTLKTLLYHRNDAVNVQPRRFSFFLIAILFVAFGPKSTKAQAISAGSMGLVISEIMYNPQGTDDFEYIEFYNAGTSSLSLEGYKLVKDEKGDGLNYTFDGEVLQSGEFILVVEDIVQFTQRYMAVDSPYFFEGIRISNIRSYMFSIKFTCCHFIC